MEETKSNIKIDEIPEVGKNPNSFFTKKKIIYFSIFFILMLILVALCIVFVLDIDFNRLINDIDSGLKRNGLAGL